MKKSLFLFVFSLFLMAIPAFSASANVYEDEYEPNNSFAEAYDVGLWKYKTISAPIILFLYETIYLMINHIEIEKRGKNV
ncbi:hypothetical protein [Bacillus sp. CX-1]|uniref:hypothetical protein n=1 Tax=Bacillus sp. CX-1 TaxID=2045018 RepID=UPI0020D21B9D|nr:hypothetical protein [Bacillus sp. CX-1]